MDRLVEWDGGPSLYSVAVVPVSAWGDTRSLNHVDGSTYNHRVQICYVPPSCLPALYLVSRETQISDWVSLGLLDVGAVAHVWQRSGRALFLWWG